MERTCLNEELSEKDVGKKVVLIGWASKVRKLGGLTFIDLRDRSGFIQITMNENCKPVDVRNEYVIQVYGEVAKKDVPNPKLKTGGIEILASEVKVINTAETTPMIIDNETDALEDTRLKYRYLDIRRPVVASRFRLRAKISKAFRDFLDENGFCDVETPYLGLSTPEGARDYLVPSRVHPGCFYALPQSPQLYKQLLMVGGMERYYQIARCFRDEDLRADRQPDFTQVDIEASFLDEDEILSLMEKCIKYVFEKSIGYEVTLPLRRMKYVEAVDKYGSDKPDTRFGYELVDLKELMLKSSFQVFHNAKTVKGIVVHNEAGKTSRKTIDELQLEAKKFNLHGYTVIKYLNNELEGSFVKFLDENLQKELITTLNLVNDDIIVIAGGDIYRDVCFGLGALRSKYAKQQGLIKPNTFDLLWVTRFPLFDYDETTKTITPCHHPFTRPVDEHLPFLMTKPQNVDSYAYDIVINGYEAGGGSLRIYDQNVQKEIFELLGFSDEDIQKKFGWFIGAFKYGTPPHGGIAFGLDRWSMILSGTDNIRDVIAFPKNLQASCPMSKAPAEVDSAQLDDLHITLKGDKE